MSYKEDMQCIISYWTCGQIIGFSMLNGGLLNLRIECIIHTKYKEYEYSEKSGD